MPWGPDTKRRDRAPTGAREAYGRAAAIFADADHPYANEAKAALARLT